MVGWKEQPLFSIIDLIKMFGSFACEFEAHSKGSLGKRFVTHVNRVDFASYIFIPGLYAACHYCSSSSKKDEPPPSPYEKRVHQIVSWTYVHIPDFLLALKVAHTVAAIQNGFDSRVNGVRLACYSLIALEQGFFWMDPKEYNGPLVKFKKGALFRTYSPILEKIADSTAYIWVIYAPYTLLFGGMLTKVIFGTTLFFYFASKEERLKRISAWFKDCVIKSHMFNKAPLYTEEIPIAKIVKDQAKKEVLLNKCSRIIPTDKVFTPFSFTDPFPNESLGDLYEELKIKLQKDGSTYLEEKEKGETRTRKEMMEELLQGLYDHVTGSDNEKEEKKKPLISRSFLGPFGKIGINLVPFLLVRMGIFYVDQEQLRPSSRLHSSGTQSFSKIKP
jgi:hypothetical protein